MRRSHRRQHRTITLVIVLFTIGSFISLDILTTPTHSVQDTVQKIYKGKPWYGLCNAEAVYDVASFRAQVDKYPDLQAFYAGFDWDTAHVTTVFTPTTYHVSYRKSMFLLPYTRYKITIYPGELLITDRMNIYDESKGFLIRVFCCNNLTSIPGIPVLPPHQEPPMILLIPPGFGVPPPGILIPPPIIPAEPETPGVIYPPVTEYIPPGVIFPPPFVTTFEEPCIPTPKEQIPNCIEPGSREVLFCAGDHEVERVPECLPGVMPSIPPPTVTTIPTPEPGTLYLFAAGLLYFGVYIFYKGGRRG